MWHPTCFQHIWAHTSPLCEACVCNNGPCLWGVNTTRWYSMENRWSVTSEDQAGILAQQSACMTWCVSNRFHALCSAHAVEPAEPVGSIGADTWQRLWRFHVWENIDVQLPPAVLRALQMSYRYLAVACRLVGWFIPPCCRSGLAHVDLSVGLLAAGQFSGFVVSALRLGGCWLDPKNGKW